jgi:hypothetical protein
MAERLSVAEVERNLGGPPVPILKPLADSGRERLSIEDIEAALRSGGADVAAGVGLVSRDRAPAAAPGIALVMGI